MNLEKAALYFDRTPVYDGYSGEFLWRCQFSSFNDANAIGSTSVRRVLSIAPGLEVPARKVIQIFSDRWLVGDGNPDSWNGDQIRQSFNIRKSNALAEILTASQACLSAAGTPVYVQKAYFKDTVSPLTDADYDPFWNFFVPPGEPVAKGTFFRTDGKLYRVRSAYLPVENLRIAQSDEVDLGPLAAAFATGAYDPVTDSVATGAINTFVLMFDFTKAYKYLTRASDRVAAGDMNALVPTSALTPVAGRTVAISGQTWRILTVSPEADCWLLHLRRA